MGGVRVGPTGDIEVDIDPEPPMTEREYELIRHGWNCPLCGAPMKERANRADRTTFFGCSKYPECRGTRTAAGWSKDDRMLDNHAADDTPCGDGAQLNLDDPYQRGRAAGRAARAPGGYPSAEYFDHDDPRMDPDLEPPNPLAPWSTPRG